MTYNGFGKHLKSIRDSLEVKRNALGATYLYSSFWQFDFEFESKMPVIVDDDYPIHRVYVHASSYPYGQTVNAANGLFSDDGVGNGASESTENRWFQSVRCLCELRQRPRVEYDFCEGSMANIQPCATEKVSQGWYPLELTSAGGGVFVQTFWRWED